MIGATLFSGIGAPEVAMPEWHWPWHAEIEKFPAAVFAAHHPRSVNLGDVTAHDFAQRAGQIARPDVLVFGSPCQDFSVAGKRLGMDGARGNLALVALALVGKLRPRWFVFENVPGLLSNWSGGPQCPPESGSTIEGSENSDFAAFLGCVDELGYFGAWASLDAQYFRLAQRRDRVFFVGHSSDWRYPAAVLFEPEGLCGVSPPRHQARQEIAGAIGAGSQRSGQRVGRREAAAGHIVAGTLNANGKATGSATQQDVETAMLIAFGMGIGATGDPMFIIGADSRHAVASPITAGYRKGAAVNDGSRGSPQNLIVGAAVRRLTPCECERLQGFPDDYTAITYRGKPAADGPRYKALGNSMAVPVMRWILTRIEFVDRAVLAYLRAPALQAAE